MQSESPGKEASGLAEFHWLMAMLQHIDVGIVVLDRDYRVCVWNGFMENHSGLLAERVVGAPLFDRFPDIPEGWLRNKADTVFLLGNRAFAIWEQRPYLFRFKNYRPITGMAPFMYQNVTIIPLESVTGEVEHVCLIVYDVTDAALGKLALAGKASSARDPGPIWPAVVDEQFRRHAAAGRCATLVLIRVGTEEGDRGSVVDESARGEAERMIRRHLRTGDVVGVADDAVFGVVLADADAASGAFFAQCLCRGASRRNGKATFSVALGVTPLTPAVTGSESWLRKGRRALAEAKATGRNTYVVTGADSHLP